MVKARFAAAAVVFGSVASTALAAGTPTYLALGDSVAFGLSTFLTTPVGFGDMGYVSQYADFLGTQTGERPDVINLAVPGESMETFLTDPFIGYIYNRRYYDLINDDIVGPIASQVEFMRQFLTEHEAGLRHIGNVSVQLGANDLFDTTNRSGFYDQTPQQQLAELFESIDNLAIGYSQVLGELRDVLPDSEIVVMGYYNPYVIVPENPRSALSDEGVLYLNSVLEDLADVYDARFVDLFTPFRGREAELTRIQTIDLDGSNNVHPTEAGYGVIAAALIPSPGALCGLLASGLFSVRRRRA